ncbi:hypothetical protein NDU88_004501 [Pleurodeles waltl]|uniref:Uncharacterized protein n=1 Tax=Pleurodeles waltl TaxID=8319 RepID=A0AAV7TUG4_PLEWA|nr:hypothetical protein NDU88_004501 [Pleurodeles waltl]
MDRERKCPARFRDQDMAATSAPRKQGANARNNGPELDADLEALLDKAGELLAQQKRGQRNKPCQGLTMDGAVQAGVKANKTRSGPLPKGPEKGTLVARMAAPIRVTENRQQNSKRTKQLHPKGTAKLLMARSQGAWVAQPHPGTRLGRTAQRWTVEWNVIRGLEPTSRPPQGSTVEKQFMRMRHSHSAVGRGAKQGDTCRHHHKAWDPSWGGKYDTAQRNTQGNSHLPSAAPERATLVRVVKGMGASRITAPTGSHPMVAVGRTRPSGTLGYQVFPWPATAVGQTTISQGDMTPKVQTGETAKGDCEKARQVDTSTLSEPFLTIVRIARFLLGSPAPLCVAMEPADVSDSTPGKAAFKRNHLQELEDDDLLYISHSDFQDLINNVVQADLNEPQAKKQ